MCNSFKNFLLKSLFSIFASRLINDTENNISYKTFRMMEMLR